MALNKNNYCLIMGLNLLGDRQEVFDSGDNSINIIIIVSKSEVVNEPTFYGE